MKSTVRTFHFIAILILTNTFFTMAESGALETGCVHVGSKEKFVLFELVESLIRI